jgi:NADH:ubiquinone oxidoreductase subunit 5 (subunit L)/multisubunit Na+/H+ antiporter MnhA subunit
MLALSWVSATDSSLYLHVGVLAWGGLPFTPAIVFAFDELAGFFFCILAFALVLCFLFLGEYFEYDAGSVNIMLLSSLFSQLALWLFCAFDVLSLVALWEAISMVSFFLIQYWSMRIPTFKAGLKVFTISQLGDFPLFLGLLLIQAVFETTDFGQVLGSWPLWVNAYFTVGPCLISVLGAISVLTTVALLLKAAQFVFYPWLLDAMEAPVPISSQLHSSTLVIIGFYVYLRLLPLHSFLAWEHTALVVLGGITIVGASTLGYFQEDGKRLLACSTASQLGYVIVGLGLGLEREALILLAFACCNKAYTFIWLGILMSRWAGLSDFRLVGGVPLSWEERAGLFVAVSNVTVAPGAFSWHVKALLSRGALVTEGAVWGWGYELLALTWFFSAIYMVALYLALFVSPRRSGALARVRLPWGSQSLRGACGAALLGGQLVGTLVLSSMGGGWGIYAGSVSGLG